MLPGRRAFVPPRRCRGPAPLRGGRARADTAGVSSTAAPPPTALGERLAELGTLVDGWTRELLASTVLPPARGLAEMIEYHLGWRDEALRALERPAPAGKRLRPALALLVAEAVCGSPGAGRAAAVAVELVHNFSLVHDDIQDRSELRRYRRTVWTVWGSEQAINVGDALFSLAQLAILQDQTTASARMAIALNEACVRLVEGQYLDLRFQSNGERPDPELHQGMVARKTGALFECACRLGAIAAGAPAEQEEQFARYGRELGIAFQEQDDILGVWGASADTGKPAAADVVVRKKGLPAALALSRPDAPAWLRALYDGTDDLSPEQTARVITHFDALRLRALIEKRVAQRYRAANAALDAAGGCGPARAHLARIAGALVSRGA